MDGVLATLGLLATLGMVLGSLAWLGSRIRRRGIGDSVMGPFDEIWHPAAHQMRIEIRVQQERVTPMPSPSDP